MLCIRRAPEERPSLSKIRRLLHRITISFIDQKKREIDREIEREFSSLFDEPPQMGSPTPQPRMSPPVSDRSGLSFEQGRGRLLVVTDDMREEQEPATMCVTLPAAPSAVAPAPYDLAQENPQTTVGAHIAHSRRRWRRRASCTCMTPAMQC